MKKLILFILILLSISIFAAGATANTIESFELDVDLINQTPDPVRAGEIVEFKFSVLNTGGISKENISSTIKFEYPFSAVPGEEVTQEINKIYSYQNENNAKILTYKLFVDKDAPNGVYEISLKLYDPVINITQIFNFDLDVSGKEYAQIITINKANIDFGVIENLEFLITNTGNSLIQNLVFSWDDSTDTLLPVNSDNTKYIKNLEVGESILVNYNVMANINSIPGLYKIDLCLMFEDSDYNESEINTTAGIFIGGQTDFDVTFSESDSGIVSLSIANIGNNPAYSVNVIIPIQDGYKITGSNSSILGNLDSGDYTITSFSVRPTGQKDSKLIVLIDYTDSLGHRNTIEKEIDLMLNTIIGGISNVSGDFRKSGIKGGSSSGSWYIYIIIVVVIGIVGYVIYNKKQKKKKKGAKR